MMFRITVDVGVIRSLVGLVYPRNLEIEVHLSPYDYQSPKSVTAIPPVRAEVLDMATYPQ